MKYPSRHGVKKSCQWLTLIAGVALAGFAAPLTLAQQAKPTTLANQQQINFQIPAQSLHNALISFASQADIQLVYDAKKFDGISSAGVRGAYSVAAGLDTLLAGTGVTYHQRPNNYIGLELAQQTRSADSADSANSSEKRLKSVVITASGFEQDIAEAPASISVITREDITERYYSDVTDVLRDIPGVTVTGGGSGDGGTDISMRGLPASYTLTLVDGKRQSSRESRPNGSAGFEQDWLPPMGAVERIEVVRGPMSTLYGSDAIGGVVNVITRKVPETWNGNVTIDTVYQENRDSGDIRQTNLYVGGPLVKNLVGLQIYGRTYEREEDQFLNGYEEKDLASLTGRLAITPNKNHEILIEAGATDQRRRAQMGVSAPTEGCRGGCTDSDSEHDRQHYSLSHQGRWSIGTSNAYIQRDSIKNLGRNIEIINTVGEASLVSSLGSHILTVGANYENQELNDYTSNQISERTRIENSQFAVFVEDEWFLSEPVSITLGARMDDDDNYGNHFSPRIYGNWAINSQWRLKGGVSTGFRSPSLREITPDWGQTSRGGNVYGNPDLEPETSINQELSLTFTPREQVTATLTLFNNDFKDKITRIQCPVEICPGGSNQFGSNPTYRINVDEAVTRGVEGSLDAMLTKTLKWTSSYTYTDSEQKSGEYAGFPLTQLPEHQVSSSLNWRASERLRSWLRLTYRGKESQPTQGPSQSSLIAPSYTVLDTGLTYKLSDALSFKVAIYNLGDEEITEEEYGYVDDGRRYWVGVDMNF